MAAVKPVKSFRVLQFELFLPSYTEHSSCVMESCMSGGQQSNMTVKPDLLSNIIYSVCEAVALREGREADGCLHGLLEFGGCDSERQDTHDGLRVLLELLLIIALVRLL